jgi:4-amino-4-deoxy-L-arabinose transferase-like glycosyltransferase
VVSELRYLYSLGLATLKRELRQTEIYLQGLVSVYSSAAVKFVFSTSAYNEMANHSFDESAWRWVALTAVTALALILRLHQLEVQSLWSDESFSLVVSTQSLLVMMQQLQSDFVHPPLYYLILHWVHNLIGLDVVTARAVSVFFGTLSVPIMYFAGSYLFNRRAGLFAAILMALSQLGVMYSQEARDYAQQMFFISTTLLFLGLMEQQRRNWAWWPLIISAVLAVYTHYYSLFAVGPLLLWAAWGAYQRGSISHLQIVLGLLFLPLSQVPWIASGIIDIAMAHPKTVPDEQPQWFDIDWGTVFNTLNKFNNGSVENVLLPGPRWTYFAGACLFVAPLLAIRPGDKPVSQRFLVGAWVIASLLVAFLALVTPSGISGMAIAALYVIHTSIVALRSSPVADNALFRIGSATPLWVALNLLAFALALYRGALGWVLFALGLLFTLTAYDLVRDRHLKIKPLIKGTGHLTLVLLAAAVFALGLPILLGVFGIQYAPRYSLAALPIYYLLVAYGISQIDSMWFRRAGVAVLCGYSLFALTANYTSGYKENWRDSMALMIENQQPSDCFATPPWDELPRTWYAYGYDERTPELRYLPSQDLADKAASCERIWLLQYSRVQSVVEDGRPFVETVAELFDHAHNWSYHWVGVTLYTHEELVAVAD